MEWRALFSFGRQTMCDFRATQFRKLQLIVATSDSAARPLRLAIYGRGRNRTLALYRQTRSDWDLLTKTHYSKTTADEAANAVARAMTLDGELPIGMREPS